MNIEAQVLSYSKSRMLSNLKFPQVGYFWWYQTGKRLVPVELRPWFKVGYKVSWVFGVKERNIVAPTASQLFDLLPQEFIFIGSASTIPLAKQFTGTLCVWKDGKEYVVAYLNKDSEALFRTRHKKLVEALGDMMFSLINRGYDVKKNRPIKI